MWADSMSACWPASQAWAANMVDERMYRRLFDERLRELTGLDKDDDLRLVAPGDYVSEKADVIKAIENKGDHVALYYAVGDIVDSGKEGIVGQTVVDDIISMADDDKVKALLLRVNSGGGSAFASEQIWEAL